MIDLTFCDRCGHHEEVTSTILYSDEYYGEIVAAKRDKYKVYTCGWCGNTWKEDIVDPFILFN